MRDIILFGHITLGLAIIVLAIIILLELRKKSSLLKPLSFITAVLCWILLLPAGKLYITFYPATKAVIKAGINPWAHSIIMETKEHWGLMLPFIATLGAILIFKGKVKESRKWWILVIILSVLLGIMGRIVKIGAMS